MNHWVLRYHDSSNQKDLGVQETLCSVGNGYFVTRGAYFHVEADSIHYPGTYLAGGYNRLTSKVGDRYIENEDLVNLPNWLPFRCYTKEGNPFISNNDETQTLLLKEGVLETTVTFSDIAGRTLQIKEQRMCHMETMHLAIQKFEITPLNFSGTVTVEAYLDGDVKNQGVKRYQSLKSEHLEIVSLEHVNERGALLRAYFNQASHEVVMTMDLQSDLSIDWRQWTEEKKIGKRGDVKLEVNQSVTIEKYCAIYTSKDVAISSPLCQSKEFLLQNKIFTKIKERHVQYWEILWQQFDLDLEIDNHVRERHPLLLLRLHIFHLLQTISPHVVDLDIGVPARGWHGEAYRGHVFWDEIYIFPTLNFRYPKLIAALLRYRFRRLGKARQLAAEASFKGAMFPWQSGSDGCEETQKVHLNPKSGRWIPDKSHLQRHVNIAIAYNIWFYYQVTLDSDFMLSYGAEMLFEIAQLFSSMATYSEQKGRYEILHVMGPDEYHDAYPGSDEGGINNNSYTNVSVSWLLCRALDMLTILPQDEIKILFKRLEIDPEDIVRWEVISKKLYVPFLEEGLISQFEGYEKLQEFDWDGYQKKYGDIHRLDRILEAEGKSANDYKLSKQADVVMLFYLFSRQQLEDIFSHLGYTFKQEYIEKNIRYYMKRSSHGSTLSRVVHAWVLSRFDRETSWNFFVEALESDISDIQGGTTREGIHLGAMAGTVDIVQRCYLGLEIRDDVLWFHPHLPDKVKQLKSHLHFRGASLEIFLTENLLVIKSIYSQHHPIEVGFMEKCYSMTPGDQLSLSIL